MEINEIYNENCIDTMSRMPDNFIDLTVTSPPYDNLRTYEDNIGFYWDFETFKPIAKELYRVTKEGGAVVWVVGDSTIKGSETGTSFLHALYFIQCGFNLHDTMIYKKINYVPLTHNRYEQCFEYMFVFSKGKPKTFNPIMTPCKNPGKIEKYGLERRSRCIDDNYSMRLYTDMEFKETNEYKISHNIFEYSIGSNRDGHPAPFPEQLANDHIISWSNVGDLVYDPFSGSGTTVKMSILNDRNFIASEISYKYYAESYKRIAKLFE